MGNSGTIFSAAGLLTKHCAMRTRLRSAIEDNLAGQPRAASFESDRTTGHGGGLFCWAHHQDAIECERILERGDTTLNGACQVESIMRPTDSTGEAAIVDDRARSDQRDLEAIERQLIQLTDRLARLGDRYLPASLPDKAGRAKLATPGEPGCYFCELAKTWSPPHTKQPTTVGGNLTEPRLVCSGHYDLIRKHLGRAPTPDENSRYVRTGQYPKRHQPA